MRILGFSRKWPKLEQPEFTTFRFPRRDRDWAVGEFVQVVYKPRSRDREVLGTAEIISREPRRAAKHGCLLPYPCISNQEAEQDGFPGTIEKPAYFMMWEWLWDTHGSERLFNEPMSKLTLRWIKGDSDVGK